MSSKCSRPEPSVKSTSTTGYAVGILHINSCWPLLLGNAQNASTYPFPVAYEEVVLADAWQLKRGDLALVDPIIAACRRLVRKGVGIIVGACGSFAYYQKLVADHFDIPVYTSVLVQTPLILNSLGKKKLGIIAASESSMNARIYEACDIRSPERLVVRDMQSSNEFQRMISCEGSFDPDRLCDDVCSTVDDLVASNEKIGAIMLQCSDLPPFASEIQRRVRLPVYDVITLVHWAQLCVRHPAYA